MTSQSDIDADTPLAAIGLPEEMIRLPMSDADTGCVTIAMRTGVPVIKTDVDHDGAVESQFRELGTKTAAWIPVIGNHVPTGVLILVRCNPDPFTPSDDHFHPNSTSDLHAADKTGSMQPMDCLPVRALLAVPVRREKRIQGMLYALRFSAASFSPDAIQIAQLFASQASAALENARLYQEVQQELAERVRAEQRLSESEERLQLALTGKDGLPITRPSTGFLTNPANGSGFLTRAKSRTVMPMAARSGL